MPTALPNNRRLVRLRLTPAGGADLTRPIPALAITARQRHDAARYVATRAAQASTHELWVHATPGQPGIRVATRAQLCAELLDILGLSPDDARRKPAIHQGTPGHPAR